MPEPIALSSALYLVATPIGNLGDITYRAVQVLKAVDCIYCEDTRKTRVLLQHYGIDTPLQTYHDHNATTTRPKIIAAIQAGQSVALVSDAGMPLISDPGYKLVRECISAQVPHTVIPGASASLAGLVLSGMPTDQFFFAGFYDAKKASSHKNIQAPLIFYESARRVHKTLTSMQQEFPDRSVAIAREITKVYEEVVQGSYVEVLDWATSKEIKGELVVILSPPLAREITDAEIAQYLSQLIPELSVKEAATKAAQDLNVPRRRAYQIALKI